MDDGAEDVAARFLARFSGYAGAHGDYTVLPGAIPDSRGKVTGQAWTRHAPMTIELVRRHLTDGAGFGLGGVPTDRDGRSRFGAIDVDVYPLDLSILLEDIARMNLPLVLARTKSGGAHLYFAAKDIVDTRLMRSRLREWAVKLGYPKVEVFPKQDRILKEEDAGNWINLPYQGGEARTTRYGVTRDGRPMSLARFLSALDEAALDDDGLKAFTMGGAGPLADVIQPWDGAPPCLIALAERGFSEGSRNNALFDIGVYLKKRGIITLDVFGQYNRELMRPPVGPLELRSLYDSVAKKNYSYRCNEAPIVNVCDRKRCHGCRFGVKERGNDEPTVDIGKIVKVMTDPPRWELEVDGHVVELQTEELLNQRMFRKKVVEAFNVIPEAVKGSVWDEMMRERLKTAEVIHVPEEATRKGQMMTLVARFCTGKVRAKSLDELLLGKPFTNPEDHRSYFCAPDLLEHLGRHRIMVNERDLFTYLRKEGLKTHKQKLKGKSIEFWSLPAFTEQTEEHAVPRAPDREKM